MTRSVLRRIGLPLIGGRLLGLRIVGDGWLAPTLLALAILAVAWLSFGAPGVVHAQTGAPVPAAASPAASMARPTTPLLSPTPTGGAPAGRAADVETIDTGDPRSDGQGPGLVGEPLLVLVAIAVIGLATVVVTIAIARLTGRA